MIVKFSLRKLTKSEINHLVHYIRGMANRRKVIEFLSNLERYHNSWDAKMIAMRDAKLYGWDSIVLTTIKKGIKLAEDRKRNVVCLF